jgi:hypothetical protein
MVNIAKKGIIVLGLLGLQNQAKRRGGEGKRADTLSLITACVLKFVGQALLYSTPELNLGASVRMF